MRRRPSRVGVELDAVEERAATRASALTTCLIDAVEVLAERARVARHCDEARRPRRCRAAGARRGGRTPSTIVRVQATSSAAAGCRSRCAPVSARVREHLLDERVGGVEVLLVLRLGHAERVGDVVEAERLLVGDEARRAPARVTPSRSRMVLSYSGLLRRWIPTRRDDAPLPPTGGWLPGPPTSPLQAVGRGGEDQTCGQQVRSHAPLEGAPPNLPKWMLKGIRVRAPRDGWAAERLRPTLTQMCVPRSGAGIDFGAFAGEDSRVVRPLNLGAK